MPKQIDLTGRRFGKLYVIEKTNERNRGCVTWLCQCDCGNLCIKNGAYLRNGDTTSCGCYQKEKASEANSTHGKSNNPIYRTFMRMIDRCENPHSKSYKDYGARGIKICDEWRNDPMKFYEWSMKNGYRKGLTIDRIDNDGNYEPNNCRWTTKLIQSNNRRTNTFIEYNGKKMTYAEWGRETGISESLIRHRIVNSHWDIEKALTTPVDHRKGSRKKVV